MFRPRRNAAHRASGVEVTPLIDVVFLLLLFLMVSTSFARGALKLELPEAQAAPAELREADVEVRVSAAGAYTVAGRALPGTGVDALLAALSPLAGPAPRLVVLADAAASHQAVVRVLDAARRAGLRDVRLATRPPREAGPGGTGGVETGTVDGS